MMLLSNKPNSIIIFMAKVEPSTHEKAGRGVFFFTYKTLVERLYIYIYKKIGGRKNKLLM